MPVYIIQQCLW